MLAQVPGRLYLPLAAVILQEDGGQVADPAVGGEREADHAFHDWRRGDVSAGGRRAQVHERGESRQHGLFSSAGQAVNDQSEPPRRQDVTLVGFVQAQVTETSCGGK
ncbi:hypothetical protein FKM82_021334 [Ascaphus truei]